MMTPPGTWAPSDRVMSAASARRLRIASLLAPMFIVTVLVADDAGGAMMHAAGFALYGIWLALVVVLGVRFVIGCRRKAADSSATAPWDHVDVLTSSGTAMLWTGVAALVLARVTGWASFSVLGVLGVGVVLLAALWTACAAVGERPWRRAKVTRSVTPAIAVEGEMLREQITIADLDVPPGMRLFVLGRAMRHGAPSRYVVDGKDACGEVKLEAELGAALRGEHQVPPLMMWFADVLGLARSGVVYRGETTFAVKPRAAAVDGVQKLLGAGGDAQIARQTVHAPTDGTFRIREYVPGDDARRVHWVRAAQRDDLVVRLPDEIPPAEPSIRLVLDNELALCEALNCRAADELLDALVRIWLGIGKALTANGTRVTLVVAAEKNGAMKLVERRMDSRATDVVAQLGSRVAWQNGLTLESMLDKSAERQIVVSARPRRVGTEHVRWVVVPEVAWTSLDVDTVTEDTFEHPFPVGSPENRRTRRHRERHTAMVKWQDRAFFSQMVCWSEWSRYAGDHVARFDRGRGRVIVEVIP
ncbi:MAG TPA: DUF58 domain-containing protein [Kofleriaceae bacterium]|nr:DUF58 domain-containing protein [Kofleriaceae bacterium]